MVLGWSNAITGLPAAVGTNRTTAVLALTSTTGVTNATLLQYQMGQSAPQVQDATNTAAGGALTPGSGLNQFTTNSTLSFTNLAGSTVPVLSLAPMDGCTNFVAALASNSWFTFTLTVGSGVTSLDITNLTFNAAKGGSSGGARGYGVYVTTPTTTNELVRGATDLATIRPTSAWQVVDLAGFASLQNLTAGQVVTFKIPTYTPSSGSTLILDDVTVNGVSTFGTIPSYSGANAVYFRVRQ